MYFLVKATHEASLMAFEGRPVSPEWPSRAHYRDKGVTEQYKGQCPPQRGVIRAIYKKLYKKHFALQEGNMIKLRY